MIPIEIRSCFKGGIFMGEKMLVTQALDERDLLVKKIVIRLRRRAL